MPSDGGFTCRLPEPRRCARLRLLVAPLCTYSLRFLLGEREVAARELLAVRPLAPPSDTPTLAELYEAAGLHTFELALAEPVTFDRIELRAEPLGSLVIPALGGLAFDD